MDGRRQILNSMSSSGSHETRRWRGQSRANPSPKPKFPVRWENTGYSLIFGSISPNLSSESQSLSGTYSSNSLWDRTGNYFRPIRELNQRIREVSDRIRERASGSRFETIRAKGAGSRRRPLRSFEGARALRRPALFCSRQRRVPQPRGQPRLSPQWSKGFVGRNVSH